MIHDIGGAIKIAAFEEAVLDIVPIGNKLKATGPCNGSSVGGSRVGRSREVGRFSEGSLREVSLTQCCGW